MGFTPAIRTCFSKYVTFSGRASRPEYWWFILFVVLASIAAGILDMMFFPAMVTVDSTVTDTGFSYSAESRGPFSIIFALGVFLPFLTAGWRRMHDTGRSGLYLLYPLIVMIGIGSFASLSGVALSPTGSEAVSGLFGLILILAYLVLMISPILVLWWLTRPSQPGENQFGPNPSAVTT